MKFLDSTYNYYLLLGNSAYTTRWVIHWSSPLTLLSIGPTAKFYAISTYIYVHCISKLLAVRLLVANVVDIGGDKIWTPYCKCHLPPIPGGSKFSLHFLTESHWASHSYAGQSSQTMLARVWISIPHCRPHTIHELLPPSSLYYKTSHWHQLDKLQYFLVKYPMKFLLIKQH